MRKLTLCISILLLLTSSIIYAQRAMRPAADDDTSISTMPEFQTYALMMAVSTYDHHPNLTNPVPDMEAIEKELREVYKCETKIIRNPTQDEFLLALHGLADREYGPNDQLLVFFAGHGWYDERIRKGYLILKDTRDMEDDPLYKTYVPHEGVRTVLERLDCQHVLLMVDSCFSGTLDPTIATANKGRGRDIYSSAPRPEYIRRKLRYKTRRYITSGGKVYVPDGRPGQHSPFARRVLESLRTFGGNDGILTLEEMMIEVEKATPEPRTGEMLDNEPGSSFVLIAGTVTPVEPTAPIQKLSSLTVVVTPVDAEVTIEALDAAQRGFKRKGKQLQLPVGRYRISAALSGYEAATQDVYVNVGGATARLTLKRMVLLPEDMALIPAGEFQMGSNDYSSEKPVHPVYVDAFYMDKYEVTNAQYKKFTDAKPQWGKSRIESKYHDGDYLEDWNGSAYPSGKADHPVVWVSWHAANAYAEWAGKRLPTEAEWEKAARGGLQGKKYPWGDSIGHDDANYRGTGGKDRWEKASPVGSFAANGYGLYDMAGNVWEWCSDWYDRSYYANSPSRNPAGPSSGKYRVLRGGPWYFREDNLRCAYRFSFDPTDTFTYHGFRCCASRSD